MAHQHGLSWEDGLFGLEPRWSIEPDVSTIETLARRHLRLADDAKCSIIFYAQGGFNKLYKVDTNTETRLMRVALPVDPYRKTASEAATIEFVCGQTDIPVPKIIAFDPSSDNVLGFEWILMDFVPGHQLRHAWRKMSMSKKEALVKQLALYQTQLFDHKFDRIGNLYKSQQSSDLELRELVTMAFFWADRVNQDTPRGPFANAYEWLSPCIAFALEDQERILEKTDDEDEIEEAEMAKSLAEQLSELLAGLFSQKDTVFAVIYHDDLSMQNILVDEEGNITAIVDWECVSALPTWRACRLPELLDGRVRSDEPKREKYALDDESGGKDTDSLDNEGVCDLYWTHMLDYERGHLRGVFLSEMEQLRADWMQEYQAAEVKNSFERAVSNVDSEFRRRKVQMWIDAYRKGEPFNLAEKFVE